MTKPIPPRYPRGGKSFIKPKLIPRGQPAFRFGIEPTFKPPAKSLKKLQITFTKEGAVILPRYGETKSNPLKIEQVRMITLPNPYTAIRYSRHQFDSISIEARAIDNVNRQVMGVHSAINREWKTFNANQKRSARNFISAVAGALGNPNALQSYFKRRAHARLSRAVELLEKGNEGAAILSLGAAANDLVVRKNQLTRQREFLERRHGELVGETTIRRTRLEKYVHSMLRRMDVLTHPLTSKGQAQQILEELRIEYRSMLKKDEDELHQATAFIREAGEQIKAGQFSRARDPLRKVNRLVVQALARQFLLSGSNIDFVQKSSNPEFRKYVWNQQLAIIADNIGFWFSRARDRKIMADHLDQFAHASETDLSAVQVKATRDAALAIRRGSGSLAEEKLMQLFAS